MRAVEVPSGAGIERATVLLAGDDVYEDLFGAGVELQELLAEEGLATRVRIGSGSLREPSRDTVIALYRAAGELGSAERRGLAEAVAGGAGLLALHSTAFFDDDEALADLIGVRYVDHGPEPHESAFRVHLAVHPVTAGVEPFELAHEHYRLAARDHADILAWRDTPSGREPLVTAHPYGRGRVCYVQFGHDLRAWGSPGVRRLIANAARWLSSPGATPAHLPTRSPDTEERIPL